MSPSDRGTRPIPDANCQIKYRLLHVRPTSSWRKAAQENRASREAINPGQLSGSAATAGKNRHKPTNAAAARRLCVNVVMSTAFPGLTGSRPFPSRNRIVSRWPLRQGHGRPEHREPISDLSRFSMPLRPRARQSLLLTFLSPLAPVIHRIGDTSEVGRGGTSAGKGTVNLTPDRHSCRTCSPQASPDQPTRAVPVASRQELKARLRAMRYSLAERR